MTRCVVESSTLAKTNFPRGTAGADGCSHSHTSSAGGREGSTARSLGGIKCARKMSVTTSPFECERSNTPTFGAVICARAPRGPFSALELARCEGCRRRGSQGKPPQTRCADRCPTRPRAVRPDALGVPRRGRVVGEAAKEIRSDPFARVCKQRCPPYTSAEKNTGATTAAQALRSGVLRDRFAGQLIGRDARKYEPCGVSDAPRLSEAGECRRARWLEAASAADRDVAPIARRGEVEDVACTALSSTGAGARRRSDEPFASTITPMHHRTPPCFNSRVRDTPCVSAKSHASRSTLATPARPVCRPRPALESFEGRGA